MSKVDLAKKLSDVRARVEVETGENVPLLPKYAQFARKDTRIRADQASALSVLSAQLMQRRTTRTERITENTLIRVAIDALLARSDQLRGSNEAELRDSVTPELPEFPATHDEDSRPSALASTMSLEVRESRASLLPSLMHSPHRNSASHPRRDPEGGQRKVTS